MERYFLRILLGSAQGVLFGVSAHVANAMTAIAIACGQDAALVANTHCANITCEAIKNSDLSAYFPGMFAATVGGGTPFGTARDASKHAGVMETANPNDSRRSSRPRHWLEKLAS